VDTESRIQRAGYREQDTESRIQRAGHREQDTESRIHRAGYSENFGTYLPDYMASLYKHLVYSRVLRFFALNLDISSNVEIPLLRDAK